MLLILNYHIISDSINDPLAIPPQALDRQLQWLAAGGYHQFDLARLDDISAAQQSALPHLLITFDDGYTCTTQIGAPIAEQYGYRLLMSVCSSYLLRDIPRPRSIHLKDDFADIAEIGGFLRRGHALAGHTFSHPKLTALPVAEQKNEVWADKFITETIFGITLNSFAYPFGKFDPAVVDIVKQVYPIAFATDDGDWRFESGRHRINRLQVDGTWDFGQFKQAVADTMEVVNG